VRRGLGAARHPVRRRSLYSSEPRQKPHPRRSLIHDRHYACAGLTQFRRKLHRRIVLGDNFRKFPKNCPHYMDSGFHCYPRRHCRNCSVSPQWLALGRPPMRRRRAILSLRPASKLMRAHCHARALLCPTSTGPRSRNSQAASCDVALFGKGRGDPW
jgi:hypothetical protein